MDAAAIALNRFGLGGRPDQAVPSDPRRWLLDQTRFFEARPLALTGIPPRAELVEELGDYLEQARGNARERRQTPATMEAPMTGEDGMPALAGLPRSAQQYLRRGIRDHYIAMNAARLAAALASEAPFVERLVHFWANHFAVSADKPAVIGLAGLLEFEAIRPHVLGRFSDMLIAVEQHPAMLLYLDQAQSIGPNSRAAARAERRGRQRGLNENLAREILELHTLGVDGGYSQSDVTELARALTGWTVGGLARGPAARFIDTGTAGEFLFASPLHEAGERTILGRRYADKGEAQAREALQDLALQPATARHLATKLARHFAGDDPPAAMVDRLARTYLESGGELASVYREIAASPEAWVAAPVKFKAPWEWLISALRGLGVEALEPKVAAATLNELGQPTWRPGSPAGWDDIAQSWAAPDALVRRVEVAERIAQRAGHRLDARVLAEQLLPGALEGRTRDAIQRAESPQQGLSLLLVSPEFLRR